MTAFLRTRRLVATLIVAPLLLVASCGGSDDEAAPDSAVATAPGAAEPEPGDDESESDDQVVCDLLSDDEVREVTGFDVVVAEGSTMGLPMCEWELAVPESTGFSGLPILSIVLLPGDEYDNRVDPIRELLTDLEGPADEMKLHFAGGGDTGVPASVAFFARQGDRGFQLMPGWQIWSDEATATPVLLDLTDTIFDRL